MKPLPTVLFLLAAAVLAAPALVGAADDPPVAVGTRVRITEGRRRYTARVLESLPGALLLRVGEDATPRRLDLSRIERLELPAGRRGHAGAGFLVGFLPGATYGALLGALATCLDYEGPGSCDWLGGAAVGGLFFGAITGAAGALVGWAVRTERWKAVDLPSRRAVRVQPHIAPVRGGVMAGLTLRF